MSVLSGDLLPDGGEAFAGAGASPLGVAHSAAAVVVVEIAATILRAALQLFERCCPLRPGVMGYP